MRRKDHVLQGSLVASVGSRLVSVVPEGDHLKTQDWVRLREELTAINVCPGSGLIVAVSPTQSAVIYRYSPGASPGQGFSIVCADAFSRNPVSCLLLDGAADHTTQVRALHMHA